MYLAIYNKGIIDPNAFRIFGMTSKRQDNSKIGYFGTGWKYAVAILMREGIGIRVISGDKRYSFGTKPLSFRGENISEITLNGKPLGFTTDLGPQWEIWMALREIFCNALDEGGFSYEYVEKLPSQIDATATFISVNQEIRQIMDDRRSWLILPEEEKDLDIVFSIGNDKIIKRRGNSCSTFKKNVRVWSEPDDQCPYDFIFPSITIDEKREAHQSSIACRLSSLLDKMPATLQLSTLRKITNNGVLRYTLLYFCNADAWKDALVAEPSEVICSEKQYLQFAEELFGTSCLVLNNEIYDKFLTYLPDVLESKSIVHLFGEEGFYPANDLTDEENEKLDSALSLLRKAKFSSMSRKIEVGQFLKSEILGSASGGRIRLSRTILLNRQELLKTLIEEETHLESRALDKTRAFQNALINKIVELIIAAS